MSYSLHHVLDVNMYFLESQLYDNVFFYSLRPVESKNTKTLSGGLEFIHKLIMVMTGLAPDTHRPAERECNGVRGGCFMS